MFKIRREIDNKKHSKTIVYLIFFYIFINSFNFYIFNVVSAEQIFITQNKLVDVYL